MVARVLYRIFSETAPTILMRFAMRVESKSNLSFKVLEYGGRVSRRVGDGGGARGGRLAVLGCLFHPRRVVC